MTQLLRFLGLQPELGRYGSRARTGSLHVTVSLNLFVTLCERLASPALHVACDELKSVFIYLAFMGTLLGGNFVSLMTRETQILTVVAWSAFASAL